LQVLLLVGRMRREEERMELIAMKIAMLYAHLRKQQE
jgi:hypothetical protein